MESEGLIKNLHVGIGENHDVDLGGFDAVAIVTNESG